VFYNFNLIYFLCSTVFLKNHTLTFMVGGERGREEGREGGREGEREGGKEGGREGGREAGRQAGRQAGSNLILQSCFPKSFRHYGIFLTGTISK
jgi:hypothetical protein